jgi:outer membrane protein TolC
MKTATRTILLLLLTSATVLAQSPATLTLDTCLARAVSYYPQHKQRALIAASKEYSVEAAGKGYLPQLAVNGQATYQSAVTEVPVRIPGLSFESVAKDQYKIYGEVTQTIYDGGTIQQQQRVQEATADVEDRKLDVDLYKLRERINQLFFGVLLLNDQIEQVRVFQRDLDTAIKSVEGAVGAGAALKSSVQMLRAELLSQQQRELDLRTARAAYVQMLGLFINMDLAESTVFVEPPFAMLEDAIRRPELNVFEAQRKALSVQNDVITARSIPRIGLFAQGGFGRPALNMLSNDFDPYYVAGARLSWSISGLYTSSAEREVLNVQRSLVDVQQETFLFNTSLALRQQRVELSKYEKALQLDDEIIALRAAVRASSNAQFLNGVLTTRDYLRDLNAEDLARRQRSLHRVQQLMAIYNYNTTSGK